MGVMVTMKDIEALRDEAAEAGDHEMFKICNRALLGDSRAYRECIRIITESRAS